jgi:predicted transcriptional regulator
MADKSKSFNVDIVDKAGTFNAFFKRITGDEEDYDFDGLAALRKLLSNEKARILYTIKHKNPNSIYKLSKLLKRDFKSVAEDIKLLGRFGIIEMIAEKTGKRERLKPVLVVSSIDIHFKV